MSKQTFFRLTSVIDLFLPRKCSLCGRTLYAFERAVCTACLYDLPKTYFWQMGFNAMSDTFNALLQAQIDRGEGFCPQPAGYVRAVALFFYRNGSPYNRLTQRLKYHYDLVTGRFFSRMLASAVAADRYLRDAEVFVPVPLHWTRKWRRGYNQAAVIARTLARELGAGCAEDVLFRCRRTATQTKLTVEEKHRNVAGAFSVHDRRLERLLASGKRHFVLVDDVFTTGATLFACYTALRRAVAASSAEPRSVRISLATLAYVEG